ncbi:MAG: cysteine hydrolase [Candidatus Aenigmarchaeota archaeon]|nr:cysteine hydrolase [Candidatus Aenigmarchaeota archaeon]
MVKLEKTVLLVVDIQNSFVEEGSPNEIEIIKDNLEKLKNFIDFCRDGGIEIIYTRHAFDREKNIIEAKLFPPKMNEALRKGSHGWEIHDKIGPKEGDIIIDKNKYDAFHGTNLNDVLRSKGTENVIITGTITQVCCESTARSAMSYDYNVIFCSDLNFSFDEELHERTLKVIKRSFGEVLNSEEIMKKFV